MPRAQLVAVLAAGVLRVQEALVPQSVAAVRAPRAVPQARSRAVVASDVLAELAAVTADGAADVDRREKAARALAEQGPAADPRAEEALLACVQETPDDVPSFQGVGGKMRVDRYVRMAAVEALGKLGTERAVPGLLAVLEESDEDLTRAAVQALGSLGTQAAPAVPALLKLLSGERGASLRIVAASALGSIQDATRALPALVDMLAEKDPLLRTAVAKAIAELGQPTTALPVLLRSAEHENPYVRLAACVALAQMLDEDVDGSFGQQEDAAAAREALAERAEDENAAVRAVVAKALRS